MTENDQQENHEQEEVTKKYSADLKKTEILKNEIALLNKKLDKQIVNENNITLSASDKGERELVSIMMRDPEQKDKHIDSSKKSNGTIIADDLKASQRIYTIQTGSFIKIARAKKQFDKIAKGLNEKEIDHLRIEKVGQYYSVRLGKFFSKTRAKKKLESVKSHIPASIMVKTDFMNERIKRMYKSQ